MLEVTVPVNGTSTVIHHVAHVEVEAAAAPNEPHARVSVHTASGASLIIGPATEVVGVNSEGVFSVGGSAANGTDASADGISACLDPTDVSYHDGDTATASRTARMCSHLSMHTTAGARTDGAPGEVVPLSLLGSSACAVQTCAPAFHAAVTTAKGAPAAYGDGGSADEEASSSGLSTADPFVPITVTSEASGDPGVISSGWPINLSGGASDIAAGINLLQNGEEVISGGWYGDPPRGRARARRRRRRRDARPPPLGRSAHRPTDRPPPPPPQADYAEQLRGRRRALQRRSRHLRLVQCQRGVAAVRWR